MFVNREQTTIHVRTPAGSVIGSIPYIVNTVYHSIDEDFDHFEDDDIYIHGEKLNPIYEVSNVS